MTSLAARRFTPVADAERVYDDLYAIYRELHDGFGGVTGAPAAFGTMMKRLLALRERVTASDA